MSDTTEQFLERARRIAESQGDSLKKVQDTTLQSNGWEVRQISFVSGACSASKSLRNKSKIFNVPEAGIESIRSKLSMKIID